VKNGVNVIQSDLEGGLAGFDAGSFDHVILSQTLQAMRHTEEIVLEMLRVGPRGHRLVSELRRWTSGCRCWRATCPCPTPLPYQCTTRPTCTCSRSRTSSPSGASHAIRILERVIMDGKRRITLLPNLRGSLAVFRFEKLR